MRCAGCAPSLLSAVLLAVRVPMVNGTILMRTCDLIRKPSRKTKRDGILLFDHPFGDVWYFFKDIQRCTHLLQCCLRRRRS